MRVVIVCSPHSAPSAAGVARNLVYARACLTDSLRRGEAPFASHLLYTQVLDDRDPAGRFQGMQAASAWLDKADAVILYVDRGVSDGMKAERQAALDGAIEVETRSLGATVRWAS